MLPVTVRQKTTSPRNGWYSSRKIRSARDLWFRPRRILAGIGSSQHHSAATDSCSCRKIWSWAFVARRRRARSLAAALTCLTPPLLAEMPILTLPDFSFLLRLLVIILRVIRFYYSHPAPRPVPPISFAYSVFPFSASRSSEFSQSPEILTIIFIL